MKLWKENKLDQEYELSHREIAKRFAESHYATKDSLEYRPLRYLLTLFIASNDGLNSALDNNPNKDLNAIEKIILTNHRYIYERTP